MELPLPSLPIDILREYLYRDPELYRYLTRLSSTYRNIGRQQSVVTLLCQSLPSLKELQNYYQISGSLTLYLKPSIPPTGIIHLSGGNSYTVSMGLSRGLYGEENNIYDLPNLYAKGYIYPSFADFYRITSLRPQCKGVAMAATINYFNRFVDSWVDFLRDHPSLGEEFYLILWTQYRDTGLGSRVPFFWDKFTNIIYNRFHPDLIPQLIQLYREYLPQILAKINSPSS